ncbi:UPF0280 family protein [Dehalococcoides sp. THU3]|uniref:UPF0280 family protein n=1 Tax=Dehalococcoides TaxID=61434 RepID=UPI0005B5773C|nr:MULTISPECIES: UPF0280 family protein [Dehalococcoides]QYY58009.1 UPF0280 family protein [Dehalococcoides mccartyi]BAQ34709.1 hypothetical protein UCH007_07510 [Dehalococcoides sp. UCH007]
MYEPRTYRNWVNAGRLHSFQVVEEESDLLILAATELKEVAYFFVRKYRKEITDYIKRYPVFASSLKPVKIYPDSSPIIRDMAEAAAKADVGPMAAVAGAVAQYVGKELLAYSPEILVENGGDIFVHTLSARRIGIFAGKSPLSGTLALEISPENSPLGICTSSGTVGHSFSFGKADAAMVVSTSAILADAAATAVANLVKTCEDIPSALEYGQKIEGVHGLVLIKDDKIGIWGDIKLCPFKPNGDGEVS